MRCGHLVPVMCPVLRFVAQRLPYLPPGCTRSPSISTKVLENLRGEWSLYHVERSDEWQETLLVSDVKAQYRPVIGLVLLQDTHEYPADSTPRDSSLPRVHPPF